MILRLFDPLGIDPRDYMGRYPELKDTPEFIGFNGRKLIFIWYYANPTSPIIDILDNKLRAAEAIKLSQWRPTKPEKLKLEATVFDDATDKAIEKMGSFEPGARYVSWMMVKDIFDEFQQIKEEGREAFSKVTLDKDGEITATDYNTQAYVKAMSDIVGQLPILIEKLERGFGVSIIKKGEDDNELENTSHIRLWNLSKQPN